MQSLRLGSAVSAIVLVSACRHTHPGGGAANACVAEEPESGSVTSYAAGLPWFEAHEPLSAEFPRDSYVKYGEARRIAPGTLRRVGERHGVPVYAKPHPALDSASRSYSMVPMRSR